jgi:hypothetical protein
VKADVAEGQERQAATLVGRRNGSRLHLRDRDGEKLAYVYFEDERGGIRRRNRTHNEARRIAANTATLPELLGRQPFDFSDLQSGQ